MFENINASVEGNYMTITFRNTRMFSPVKCRLLGEDGNVIAEFKEKEVIIDKFYRGYTNIFVLQLVDKDGNVVESSEAFSVKVPFISPSKIGTPLGMSFDNVIFGNPVIELAEAKTKEGDVVIAYSFDGEPDVIYTNETKLVLPTTVKSRSLLVVKALKRNIVINTITSVIKRIAIETPKSSVLNFIKYRGRNYNNYKDVMEIIKKYGKMFADLVDAYCEYVSSEKSSIKEMLKFGEYISESNLTDDDKNNLKSILEYAEGIEKPFLVSEFNKINILKKMALKIMNFGDFSSELETEYKYAEREIRLLITSLVNLRMDLSLNRNDKIKYSDIKLEITSKSGNELIPTRKMSVIVVDEVGMDRDEVENIINNRINKHFEGLTFVFINDIINKCEVVSHSRIPASLLDQEMKLVSHIVLEQE